MGNDDGEDDGETQETSWRKRTTVESYKKKAAVGWPAEPRGTRPPLRLASPWPSNNHGSNYPPQMQPENVAGQPANLGLDSITLGQLRSMVGSAPKPKVFVVQTLRSNLMWVTK